MKRINIKILKKQILSLLLLYIFSVLVWYGGPHITISDEISFESPLKRGYIICIFFLSWILKFIFIDLLLDDHEKISPIPTETQKKLTRLQGKFQGALAFLKKTVVDKSGKPIHLASLPWMLMIGPKNSGKTTLLAHSQIQFILAKQFKSDSSKMIMPSENCDWWVTRDMVLVDIPGSFLPQKKKTDKTTFIDLFHYFLDLTKKFHIKPSLQGIVLTLNLPEIMKDDQWAKSEIIYDLKKRLNELLLFHHRLPIHLVITKCDLLPGFHEFFNDSSADEIGQAWGITLPPTNKNENLSDVFVNRFNVLIKRINTQLLTRLHQERNQYVRPYIKDFPLHLERLKEAMVQFIKVLMLPHLPLYSVYLTSGTQDIEGEQPPYLAENPHALQLITAPQPMKKAYFVRQLLMYNLLASSPLTIYPKRTRYERHLVYAASIGIIVTASLLLGRDFQHSVQRAYSIQNVLSQYQIAIKESPHEQDALVNTLPLLNALRGAGDHPKDKLLLSFYTHKSQQTAYQIYYQSLQTIVIPTIKHTFENYLAASNDKNPEQVYAVLKAYLMLDDREHANSQYIVKMLLQCMPIQNTKDSLTEMSIHIETALNSHPLIKLNTDLIAEVRKRLTLLPNAALGFVILKNMENNSLDSMINLGTHFGNPPVFTSSAVATQIPSMFTAKEFQKIMTHEIDTAANEAIQGNWVIGKNTVISDQAVLNSLANEMRKQYIANYVDIWESLLENLKLTEPKNIIAIASMTKTLTSDNSPLIQVLDSIKQNTSFAPITTASPKLQNLSTLLFSVNNTEESTLYRIFVSIKDLDNYLQPMVKSSDISYSTFLSTVKRMQDNANDPISRIRIIANQAPPPLKTWLNKLSEDTWQCMLNESAHLIETAWKNNIMQPYHAYIENRYPFNQKSKEEVDLQQFTKFLGSKGELTQFYQTYLKPFVIEDAKWQWRVVDNQKLPFSNQILERLNHATSLQRAFFPNGDNKLFVPFALQPIYLESKVKKFTLDINGQEIHFQKNKESSERMISWPGPNTVHATTIHFVSSQNEMVTEHYNGDWGWFKLVNLATKNIRTRKEIELGFNLQGTEAKYVLFTTGHLNPFLPLNLERFSLPQNLT